MKFLKRLFGLLSDPEKPAKAAVDPTQAAKTSQPSPVVTPPRVFIGWSEMIDARGQIGAYILRPRGLSGEGEIDAGALHEALLRENVARFANQRPLVIPISAQQWQAADFRAVIAGKTHILITDLATLAPDAATQRVSEIHSAGARVAANLDVSAGNPLPAGIDLLLIDFQKTALNQLEQKLGEIRSRHPAMQLAADDIRSWDEYRLCQTLGFNFCVGSFATTPDNEVRQGKISESRLVVMEMLNQIRSGAEFSALASTATRDPAVVVKLLDMANSPLYGLPRKVANLEEALMLLGSEALYRWLSLALFHLDANSGRDRTLLVLALCRAALLEGVVPEGDRRKADELFLVGLLSVIDSLLGLPMADILARIRLPDAVADALLKNEGPYARYLQLALMLERCRLDQAMILAGAMQISTGQLLDSYREALGWASAELGGS